MTHEAAVGVVIVADAGWMPRGSTIVSRSWFAVVGVGAGIAGLVRVAGKVCQLRIVSVAESDCHSDR